MPFLFCNCYKQQALVFGGETVEVPWQGMDYPRPSGNQIEKDWLLDMLEVHKVTW